MDSAADSLLALSNTAAALAAVDRPEEEDDDRSSSLSELDDEGEDDFAGEPANTDPLVEPDSEAETERLEISPDKLRRKSFGATPSKLAHSVKVDDRPEIESLTESDISSPIASQNESDDLSDVPDDEDTTDQGQRPSSGKRKREQDEEQDEEGQARNRRRRTGSIGSEDGKSDLTEEDEASHPSREASVDREIGMEANEDEGENEVDPLDEDKADFNEEDRALKQKLGRLSSRLDRDDVHTDLEADEDVDPVEDSDEVEVDDAEAAAKSEEEQANRVAAMESLLALERHFAALRDRLYDERIAAINQELAQLKEVKPVHSELLKQLEVVKRYRDEKFETEQKLLVYKIGALKNKSVAERSQLHSAYFQTVRDIREKHLERLSEHFYRIQRDRFKTESATPSYAIPFPTKKSKQIKQQMAYNKEVSIVSGIAKYVGFPAAPEIPHARPKELEDDLQKMGISTQVHNPRPVQRIPSGYTSDLIGGAAEEQFLEKNPWANPQHPIHRLAINRQNSNQSSMHDNYLTPAQQRTAEQPEIGGSASTIPEHPSAQVSSAWNTPHDIPSSQAKAEPHNIASRVDALSPLHAHRAPQSTASNHHPPEYQAPTADRRNPSSPMTAHMALTASPSRPGFGHADSHGQHPSSSPSQGLLRIAAGGGYAGVGRIGLF